MPMHPVTSTLMYRGICTIPDILSYRAPVNLPEDEVEEIREAFKVFDRDGNGFISKQELGMAMRSLGYMPNEVELEVIIQRLDMDGDGQVDFEEFVTLLGPKLTAAGMPDKFNGTDFDSVFWKVIIGLFTLINTDNRHRLFLCCHTHTHTHNQAKSGTSTPTHSLYNLTFITQSNKEVLGKLHPQLCSRV
uniref:Calcium binding protein 7 n=1 Tax=Astyanax mexicanus TaxID=7994 RepID=A0A8B9HH46_ASTMX